MCLLWINQPTAVERIWHAEDDHSQILALAFGFNSLKRSKLFPFRLDASQSPHRFRANMQFCN